MGRSSSQRIFGRGPGIGEFAVPRAQVPIEIGPKRSTTAETTTYFALVFAISTPFWVLGAISNERLTSNLSLGSLMIFAPFVAAVVLTARERQRGGVRRVLKRAVDIRAL